ncbi:hypothetical protein CBS147343_485 [Aspergillus niger]|nr:hypothetical protein CBS11350_1074 [Aspergillus niger]KAI2858210.1 hypothetical protein CBS12448_6198 [Aspergillus niger]KAI2907812.1 hypothetical protein CBS147371_10527 [Aspergillus niger]KAI2939696.1 hypothetical protein CBS147321_6585 [Aspergillus niger]KAI2947883.1 hypothetical protein CBS147322_6508 [Aspergillus niger]
MGILESIISSAADKFQGADERSVRRLLGTILERIKRSPDLINPHLLLETVISLTKYVLAAVFGPVGSVSNIREAVFKNEINATTLILVRDQAAELAKFVLDLVEASKCYYMTNGQNDLEDEHVLYAEFNELDFSVRRNQHAAICQIQRLTKSVIYILQDLFKPINFGDIHMSEETKLQSNLGSGLPVPHKTTPSAEPVSNRVVESNRSGKKTSPKGEVKVSERGEKWLFVNGIGGEIFWLQLACNKLRAMFSREINWVFNRGDGLLWDLIECAGQRNSYVQNPDTGSTTTSIDVDGVVGGQGNLIDSTASSKEAQEALHKELLKALREAHEKQYVIMIAHSQGCLILRRVLEDLITAATKNSIIQKKLQEQLCIFTFGNPSLHWKTQGKHPSVPSGTDGTNLSSHILRTEHFANRRDFVARLGVLSEDSEYGSDEIFINERGDWIGHLFGTQYSFNSDHYQNSHHQHSWLLGCRFGRSLDEARGKLKHLLPVSPSPLKESH